MSGWVDMNYFKTRTLRSDQLAEFSTAIRAANLATYSHDSAAFTPIPASCSALQIEPAAWRQLEVDCRLVLRAMRKTVAWLTATQQDALHQKLYGELAGIEAVVASSSSLAVRPCATLRMDLFFAADGLKIIEVNATIPAMQAYSDMVTSAFTQATADHAGYISNTDQLLGSLRAHAGAPAAPQRIAIVTRVHDSQTAELQWYVRAWQARGHQVVIGQPEQLAEVGGVMQLAGVPIDWCYRHIFASRLTPAMPLYRWLTRESPVRVFNPVAAHMESKALLGVLSEAGADASLRAAIGIDAAEVRAIRERVPWTRIVEAGADVVPGSADAQDLCHWIKNHPEQFVLKSSSGYGGHRVIIGAASHTEACRLHMAQIAGRSSPISWSDFVDWCCRAEQGLWIAQERVAGASIEHEFIDRDGSVCAARSYIDCAMFLNEGVTAPVYGAASRFAPDPVVNIGRGGGVVPVLTCVQNTT